jgi:rhodanese-related sulfurtransferase
MNTRIILTVVLGLLAIVSCNHTPVNKKLSAAEFRLQAYSTAKAIILDVRQSDEFDEGHIKDAVNIPWNDEGFVEKVSSIDKSTPIFLYCLTGGRSSPAAETMHKMGYKELYELDGGILTWRAKGYPQEGSVPHGIDVASFESMTNEQPKQLFFFKANWNKNSQKLIPQVKDLLIQKKKGINLVLIDVDSNQQLTQNLSIAAIPTLYFYTNGKLVWQYTGLPELSLLEKNLN